MDSVNDLPEKQVRQVVNLLLQENQLVKVTESLYFDAQQLNDLGSRITEFIREHGEIDAPRFKDLTGLTRKFSIPLLEYFDKIKLTIRIGDKRVLRKEIK
jgi:selenocysteine-specific elongation factor